jgi:hydrogenase-1 operon protein HyaF
VQPDVIPLHFVPSGSGLTGNAPPLLCELLNMLDHLLQTGETSAIDLSALPLTPADLDWLRATLGPGEIAVTLHANGDSTLEETAHAGVWWVTHRNEQGVVGAQFVEVAFVPELIKAHPTDVADGRERLASTIGD